MNVSGTAVNLKAPEEMSLIELEADIGKSCQGIPGLAGAAENGLRILSDKIKGNEERVNGTAMQMQGVEKIVTRVEISQAKDSSELEDLKALTQDAQKEQVSQTESLVETKGYVREAFLDGSHTGASFTGVCRKVSECCKRTLYIAVSTTFGALAGYFLLPEMTSHHEAPIVGATAGALVGGCTVLCIIKCKNLGTRCWTQLTEYCKGT